MKEYKYKINGTKFTVTVGDVVDNQVMVEVNGVPYKVEMDNAPAPKKPTLIKTGKAAPAPRTETGEKVVAKAPVAAGAAYTVKAPLPGTITSFAVKEGQTVNAGDTVCMLEAMKMENDIHTQKGGVVKKILVGVGDAVADGGDIMIIE